MANSGSRILVTHVGSLVRPPEMIPYLEKIAAGEEVDQAAFAACEAEAVKKVVRERADVGVDIVSDGEYGKSGSWSFYILRRLTGIEARPLSDEEAKDPDSHIIGGRDREAFPEFYGEYDKRVLSSATRHTRLHVTGELSYTGQDEIQRDIANLKAGLEGADVLGGFLPVVAPASALPNAVNDHYPDEESYLFALADALAVEYRAIIDAGLYLQVDDAFFPYMYEKLVPPMTMKDYRDWAELRIGALNRALEGIPPERVRYHVCWGSWNGPHIFDVAMKDIVDIVLSVNAGAYAFEAANPRHEHEWKVWKDVDLPAEKMLIPGLIAHSTNVVEHPELVAERLMKYANIVGRDRVMAGTDCGFSQSPLGARVHRTIMWAKLKALAEGAEIATRELWG